MRESLKTLCYFANAILYLVIIALWLSIPGELILCGAVTVFNVFFTVGLFIWDRKRLSVYYESSQFRSFSQVFFSAILIFMILGLVNYLAYKNPAHVDFTATDHNSLTDQTVQVVEGIERDIEFRVFAQKKQFGAIRQLLELYRLENSNIEMSFIDVELRPDLVEKEEITKSGTIVVEIGDRKEYVTKLNELSLTNALVKLTRKNNPKVYFTEGHGEKNLQSEKGSGLSHLRTFLQKSNFDLKRVNLLSVSKIPQSVSVLVILGPSQTLAPKIVEKISAYLEEGGKLILGLGPNLNEDKQPHLRKMLRRWGVNLQNSLVIDQVKHIDGSQGTVPMINEFETSSPLTKEFSGTVFFPLASPTYPLKNAKKRVRLIPIVKTSSFPASWAETSADEIVEGELSYHEGEDVKGPIPLGVTAEERPKEESEEADRSFAHLVVFGNSRFVTNSYKKFEKNFQLFMNAVNWTAGEDRLISLNVPVTKNERVFISAPQLGIIFYFSVIFAPLVLFIIAFLAYQRKTVA